MGLPTDFGASQLHKREMYFINLLHEIAKSSLRKFGNAQALEKWKSDMKAIGLVPSGRAGRFLVQDGSWRYLEGKLNELNGMLKNSNGNPMCDGWGQVKAKWSADTLKEELNDKFPDVPVAPMQQQSDRERFEAQGRRFHFAAVRSVHDGRDLRDFLRDWISTPQNEDRF